MIDDYDRQIEKCMDLGPRQLAYQWAASLGLFAELCPTPDKATWSKEDYNRALACGCPLQVQQRGARGKAWTDELTQMVWDEPDIPTGEEDLWRNRPAFEAMARVQRHADATFRKDDGWQNL